MHISDNNIPPLERDPSVLPPYAPSIEGANNIQAAKRVGRVAGIVGLAIAGASAAGYIHNIAQPATAAIEVGTSAPEIDSPLDTNIADVAETQAATSITTGPAEVAPVIVTTTVPSKAEVTTRPTQTTVKTVAPRVVTTTPTTAKTASWSSPNYTPSGSSRPEVAPQPDPAIVTAAKAELGKSGAYSEGGFWCVQFVSAMANKSSINTYIQYSDSPELVANKARANGSIKEAKDVKPGDVALIDLFASSATTTSSTEYPGYPPVTHAGIVVAVNYKTAYKGPIQAKVVDSIETIERNPGNHPTAGNADVVVRMTRPVQDPALVGFASIVAPINT